MMTFNEFGAAVNHLFESQMQWSYDNGIFYISGRDIIAGIIGFLVCLVLWMIFNMWKEGKK